MYTDRRTAPQQTGPQRVGRWQRPALAACHPLHAWLRDPASLTARIEARCGRLSVRVLGQGLSPVHRDELALLGQVPGRRALLREVLLLADGVPVVYARSVLAPAALRGPWRLFAGMGARPLGAALFADPQVRRGVLAARRLDGRDARFRRACALAGCAGVPQLWARRSVFVRRGAPLVVCEVFLPAILALRP